MSNATFALNCVGKILRISVQHKCRAWVLSNRPSGNRRWLQISVEKVPQSSSLIREKN